MCAGGCSVAASSGAVEDYNMIDRKPSIFDEPTVAASSGAVEDYNLMSGMSECGKVRVTYTIIAQERQQKAQEIAEKKRLADERTAEAQEALTVLERVLAQALAVVSTVDWESLKDYTDYPVPRPEKPAPPKPLPPEIQLEPRRYDPKYMVEPGILDRLIPSRRTAKIKEADEQFERDHQKWQEAKEKAIAEYEPQIHEYERKVKEQKAEYEAALSKWGKEREEYLKARDKSNAAIDTTKKRYLSGEPQAVLDYCSIVLSNSEYPDYFSKSYELDYNPENMLLLVDYQLPPINSMPTLREIKYVQTRDEFDEKHITKTQLNRLYDSLLYQIALRTVHELYEADKINALASIVFNGYVRSIDPATGQETNACVLSLQVSKDEFGEINLANVDPKVCFKKLKGVGSSKLHSLTPIAPIMRIEREDQRFISAYAVADTLGEEDNIAAMD